MRKVVLSLLLSGTLCAPLFAANPANPANPVDQAGTESEVENPTGREERRIDEE
jgi:hypothetical protein